MGLLKKIQHNCKKATFLIDKQLISKLSLWERIELKIHLASCSVCTLYQLQSRKISDMVRQLFQSKAKANNLLDDSFKNGLQNRIEEELNKN